MNEQKWRWASTIIMLVLAVAVGFTLMGGHVTAQGVAFWTASPDGTTLEGKTSSKLVLDSGAAFLPTPGATVIIPAYAVTPEVRYGTTPVSEICGSQVITGTGFLVTGLTTPAAVGVSLGGDANYDHGSVSFTNSAATVTAKVWNGAATPAAATTGVAVDWCVRGAK